MPVRYRVQKKKKKEKKKDKDKEKRRKRSDSDDSSSDDEVASLTERESERELHFVRAVGDERPTSKNTSFWACSQWPIVKEEARDASSLIPRERPPNLDP